VKESVMPSSDSQLATEIRPSLRASRQKSLRMEMVSAGLQLFMEQGYEATTVVQIADRVGVSRRTFFRHFQSKDDVVFDWMAQLGERVIPMLDARPIEESPLRSLRQTFLALAAHLMEQELQARALIGLIYTNAALAGRYHDEHSKWEQQFVLRLQHRREDSLAMFHLQVQVSTAITAFVVAIRTWAGQQAPGSLTDWVEKAFDALCAGDPRVGEI
jgi:AcrR family transcriptional regulator